MVWLAAIRRSVMEAAQKGTKASSILAEKIPNVAAEMEKIVTSPDSSPSEKLEAAKVLAKLHSRTVALENGLRRRAVANAEDRGRKARLELRKQEREEKRARKQARIAEQLRRAELEIEESK